MQKKFFYLALTPTASKLPFIYSNSFSIEYSDDNDLSKKQRDLVKQFRAFNGNPSNYNEAWSSAYSNLKDANTNRASEIKTLQNAGKIVQEPNWP